MSALATLLIGGCLGGAAAARAAAYQGELEECNRQATTLAASIRCENAWRAAHGRPLRAMPDAGPDAGQDGGS
jgi:hypothetical protein